ncbi:MAG TPA: hypothetical protein VFQ29_09990, partial [Methyloceanibacter sp.]|nr:hypothetical protein [Methyloceanibacter sp.]
RAFSSLSKQRNEPLRMTGLEAGPKMLSGFRCVHTLKKRMLIGSPLSAKRQLRETVPSTGLASRFDAGRGKSAGLRSATMACD